MRIAFGAPPRPCSTIGCDHAMHDLPLARVGIRPCSVYIRGIQFLLILFFSSCSGTRTLRKGGSDDTLTGDFVDFGTFSSFPATYHVLGTIHSFLFDSGHSPTVWWWVLYIIDCDMNVIVFFAFGKFVSVSSRSWARLSGGDTVTNWVSW